MRINKKYKIIIIFLSLVTFIPFLKIAQTTLKSNILLIIEVRISKGTPPIVECSSSIRYTKSNSIDALRLDHLGCYGYKRNTSLSIDRLAKDGVLFTQAISQASVTLVSVASFFTSVYPSRHRIITQHLDYNKRLLYPTIIDIFKDKGYQTAIFLPYGKFLTRWLETATDYNLQYKYTRENFLQFSKADFLTKKQLNG